MLLNMLEDYATIYQRTVVLQGGLASHFYRMGVML